MAKSYIGQVNIGSDTNLVGSTLYGTSSTLATTGTKLVTLQHFNKLMNGVTIRVKFKYANTSEDPVQLNVNSLGAKPVYVREVVNGSKIGPGNTAETSWQEGAVVTFTYESESDAWWMNGSAGGSSGSGSLYGTCSTTSAKQKDVVLEGGVVTTGTTPPTGTTVHVKFTDTNSYAGSDGLTMAVGTWAPKPFYLYGTTSPGATAKTSWLPNQIISVTFDGTNWVMNDFNPAQELTNKETADASYARIVDSVLEFSSVRVLSNVDIT